jgi:hypothetical protein
VLETVDIEHTDEGLSVRGCITTLACQALVDDVDKPLEQARIEELGYRVANDHRLRRVEGRCDLLRAGGDLLLDRPLLEVRKVDAEEARRQLQCRVRVVDARVITDARDLDVTEV